MSNRFHSKFHRKNHHTYSNYLNPDSGHDPIASREQPFQGDFILSGSLSCVAPASGFGGFFYTDNTALCAVAGKVGAHILSYGPIGTYIQSNNVAISANAPVFAGQLYSSQVGLNVYGGNNGIISYSPYFGLDVFGGTWGGRFKSTNRALSAFGGQYGLDVISSSYGINSYGNNVAGNFRSPSIALSASGGNIGLFSYSPSTGVKAIGDKFGGHFRSDNVGLSSYGNSFGLTVYSPTSGVVITSPSMSLSTDGGGVNVLNSRTGIFKNPQSTYPSITGVVLDVNGGVYIDGDISITGNLSAFGAVSYLETNIIGFSALRIENISNVTPAATFVQYSQKQPTLLCYNDDPSTATPELIVSGNRVGINTKSPNQTLTVNGVISGNNNLYVGVSGNNDAVLTIYGTLSSTGNSITTNLSAYEIYLQHPTPNDGVNPFFFIGEVGNGSGSTTNGKVSGFLTTYDEINGRYILSNKFEGTTSAYSDVSALVIDSLGRVGINGIPSSQAFSVYGVISGSNSIYASNQIYSPSYNVNSNTGVISIYDRTNNDTNYTQIYRDNNVTYFKNKSDKDNLKLNDDGSSNLLATTITGTATINGGSSTTASVNINTGSATSTSTTNIHTGVITGALGLGNTGAATNINGSTITLNSGGSNNVSIGTATAGTMLTVNGPIATKAPSIVTLTSNAYSVQAADSSIIINNGTTQVTLTLPTASSFPGRWLYIKNISACSVISNGNVVKPLATDTAGSAILTNTAGKFAALQSDGANWIIMMAN
ncbi:MAG: hypothetical protein EBQ92_14295 [Proteobacteria bacterium]|nr:hypothetical protein [Pseudomonadota bacterium]